ncbi:YceI family protein [Candidatus Marinimicrobia bacterium]|nr:YceI family protein [Candidatus Neomarinimicrobiota bacterium]MDC3333465.1 YceI family protein [Candidatus Neomarinimicrobiota bacterium]|tara:strand:+ start:767 stop:1408 length:642 start_codon:yes stop_codon:yes gene_type:complete
MKKYLSVFALLTIVLSSCAKKSDSKPIVKNIEMNTIKKGGYKVDSFESKLVWKGRQLSSKEHDGTLDISSGSIEIDKSGRIFGDIKIDMKSISTSDLEGEWKDKLDGHLKSPDFFNVKGFPTATVTFKGNQNKTTNGEINFEGDLTIKGITQITKFSAKINQIGDKVIATASISFDRSEYDIRYGSGKFFDNLGDKLIYDEITAEVSIVAKML